MKTILVFISTVLLIISVQGAAIEFRLLPGETESISLGKVRELNKSPSDADQPGVVTVSVDFKNGKKIGGARWERNLPRAGKTDFFQYVRDVVDQWEYYDSIDVNGSIHYTVMTNGNIKIDVRDLRLPNYVDYKLADAPHLVKTLDFMTDDLVVKMDSRQVFGNETKNLFQKLGWFYAGLFIILSLALVLFSVYTSYQTNMRLVPPYDNFINTISKLWIKTASRIDRENRLFGLGELFRDDDSSEGEASIEYPFIKNLAQLMASGKMGELENVGEENEESYDYKSLGEDIIDMLEENEGKNNHTFLFEKVKKKIWSFFLLHYITKAKNICLKYKDYRLSRIFLTGLNAHLTNMNHWFASSEIDKAVARSMETEQDGMKGGLEGLWVIGSISPMLGLFGTVTGISTAFARISEAGKMMEQSELIRSLAEGINTALYTTIVGLAVGIVALLLFYYFQFKIEHIMEKWEKLIVDITVNF